MFVTLRKTCASLLVTVLYDILNKAKKHLLTFYITHKVKNYMYILTSLSV